MLLTLLLAAVLCPAACFIPGGSIPGLRVAAGGHLLSNLGPASRNFRSASSLLVMQERGANGRGRDGYRPVPAKRMGLGPDLSSDFVRRTPRPGRSRGAPGGQTRGGRFQEDASFTRKPFRDERVEETSPIVVRDGQVLALQSFTRVDGMIVLTLACWFWRDTHSSTRHPQFTQSVELNEVFGPEVGTFGIPTDFVRGGADGCQISG